ncbi:hypothetical protein [Microbacterium hydrocarbonoxydans]|uniref:hypothetical protein n=1 Tax=Microbacterium hydrocarbonoxydans TaxID=273678 RepID=UPI0013D9495C|nr:hypothetical protein [Microbacterium hydrocarbonoxydans]
MSTSDQQEKGPLTRKQLREIRLTGSTPVITAEEAAAAASAPPAAPLPRAAEPVEVPPAPVADADVDLGSAPLTRRQAREQERIKTASVPVVGVEDEQQEDAPEVSAATPAAPAATEDATPDIVSAVPVFATPAPTPAEDADLDDDADEQVDVVPVSAAASVDTVGEVPLIEPVSAASERDGDEGAHDDAADAVAALGIEVVPEEGDEHELDVDDVLADVHEADGGDVIGDDRPTVSSAFGSGVLGGAPEQQKPLAPSFDELLTTGDTTGSQSLAPNTLIFNPSPGEGSLSGPVASTGEILVTGSYELPQGIGSQGHAHGTADGKEVDAVLIDGELPPASSPTPIAASSAVSTIKPAGEVIRPPAPEKGNKLMLTLAIVAGGLALAVVVAVVIAFTTNVF